MTIAYVRACVRACIFSSCFPSLFLLYSTLVDPACPHSAHTHSVHCIVVVSHSNRFLFWAHLFVRRTTFCLLPSITVTAHFFPFFLSISRFMSIVHSSQLVLLYASTFFCQKSILLHLRLTFQRTSTLHKNVLSPLSLTKFFLVLFNTHSFALHCRIFLNAAPRHPQSDRGTIEHAQATGI